MGRFELGIGTHAGSVWFCQHVMDSPEHGVRFMNERLSRWVKGDWDAHLKQVLGSDEIGRHHVFDPYFGSAENMLSSYRVFCDFNSWAPPDVPYVNSVIPIARVIVLMRNGIEQLNSLINWTRWGRRAKENSWIIAKHFHRLWEVGGAKGKPWQERTLWEMQCEGWASTIYLIDWMQEQGLNVEVYRLEDLTQDPIFLQGVIRTVAPSRSVPIGEIIGLQRTDVNRHMHGTRTAEGIWNTVWTQEQRDAFIELCGEGMERYGYETPGPLVKGQNL